MSAEQIPAELLRLVGQRPAAFRAVRWVPVLRDYLEIETKHGQVVVIDPASGAVFANPPRPPDTAPDAQRLQSDLTGQLPAAFDDRPLITAVTRQVAGGAFRGWRFVLSTGAVLTLLPDNVIPVVVPASAAAGCRT